MRKAAARLAPARRGRDQLAGLLPPNCGNGMPSMCFFTQRRVAEHIDASTAFLELGYVAENGFAGEDAIPRLCLLSGEGLRGAAGPGGTGFGLAGHLIS
ncbi:MAG: hypothetical protein IPH43_03395 [Xanthomonadales bacterium]|nr:hypothetical protein [Xanthomonadales bacterium]